MQFRVVRAVDVVGEAAGCWLLTRWRRHRVIAIAALNATGQRPCNASASSDVVTLEYLEHHAPLQGDDVRGDALVGFMPRARTGYKFVAGGVQVPHAVTSMPQCVDMCAHGFATEWHAANRTCLCFADDSAARIQLVPDTEDAPNVMISGRRPGGGRVLGPGPVPTECQVLDTVPGASGVTQCDVATSSDNGFVLGPNGCRRLSCGASASVVSTDTPSADIVQLHHHPVVRPVPHDQLAFGDFDVPVSEELVMDAAACCAKCNQPEANSYQFHQATGQCQCFDARAKVCAPTETLVILGNCRFCAKSKDS